MRIVLAIIIFLTACQAEHNDAHIEKSPNEKIAQKLSLYCEKSREEFQRRKWAVDECDGLLFTSLRGVACGDIDIHAFESTTEPGRWYRNPKKDCFVADKVDNGSDSTISKDMYVGLSAYLVQTKDEQTLHRTIDYGESHSWVVGEAEDAASLASKCYLTPPLQTLLRSALSYSEGGTLTGQNAEADADGIGINSGFQAHLDVLSILVHSKIAGQADGYSLYILKAQAHRQPRNALFQIAKARYDDGDFSAGVDILLNESLFPADNLPTNKNYCTNYLWQRDDSPGDWGPCEGERTYDGTDFVFAAALYLGRF